MDLAGLGAPDGDRHVVGVGVLEQVARRPRLERGGDPLLLDEAGERDDLDVRAARLDLGRGGDPVHDRHQQVHEHDVGLELADELDGAPPVLGLAHDLDVVEQLEEPVQAAADDRVVVDQQHLDPRRRLHRDAVTRPVHRREHSRPVTRTADSAGRVPSTGARAAWADVSRPAPPCPRDRRRAARPRVSPSRVGRIAAPRPFPARRPEPDRRERDADLAEDLDGHEEPGEQEQHAQELAQLVQVRRAGPVERVGERREERPERDQQRRRHARVEAPRQQLAHGAGQRGDEVDGDRDDGDAQVEQELLARLAGVERVAAAPASWA